MIRQFLNLGLIVLLMSPQSLAQGNIDCVNAGAFTVSPIYPFNLDYFPPGEAGWILPNLYGSFNAPAFVDKATFAFNISALDSSSNGDWATETTAIGLQYPFPNQLIQVAPWFNICGLQSGYYIANFTVFNNSEPAFCMQLTFNL